MPSKTLALIALSAGVAIAKPQNGHWWGHGTGHHHHPRPTGGWGGWGGDDSNSTTTITQTSTFYSTVTVQPATDVNAVNNVADASVSTCYNTVTSTTTEYTTVTAGAVPSVSAGGFWGESSGYSAYPSATASSTGSYTPSSGSGGNKKGICFNDASNIAAFGSSVTWAYNWASTESGDLGSVEYVPMMWGANNVDDFASKVGNAKNVLSFNEPDLGAQSNLDPQTAAQKHKQGMQSLVGKVRIGSPAVTNANTTSPLMGQQWLEEFFQACGSDCPVDFIACHWYATADSIDYFKTYMDNMSAFAKSKGINSVWLTEFQPEGSADAQASFMKEAISYLESNPTVERYAGFMAGDGTMMSGGSLNALGAAYAG